MLELYMQPSVIRSVDVDKLEQKAREALKDNEGSGSVHSGRPIVYGAFSAVQAHFTISTEVPERCRHTTRIVWLSTHSRLSLI
jgi:hypothetical protein